MNEDRKFPIPMGSQTNAQVQHGDLAVDQSVVTYIKQVYALLAASLVVAVAAGYVGMTLPFPREHPYILMAIALGALFLAMAVKNAATLFLFTGISGLSIGPIIAIYVGAGLSHIVGQAMFLTGAIFFSLTFYAMTTKKDLSVLSGMAFAGLIVILVGGLINLFLHSSAVGFALSAVGALVFSGYILFETQGLKREPWVVAPSVAALQMYLNVVNLFLSLLRLLGAIEGKE
ncbi:MAG: Bax inhibitor-1/YccA family protein [Magnetococcales bacterium]|nr:Bax inhibitor-1/YccA family protein [Magnetococcales bacterium]MBF0420434.1 Bax inhibitor-1/YccA family protein [Magnetococcales bacterium]